MATIGRLVYQVIADVQQFAQGAVLTRNELRESRRAFAETRTASESYGLAVDALAKQHEKGALDAQTYNRRLDQLKKEFDEMSGAASRRAEVIAKNTTADERYRQAMLQLNQEMLKGIHSHEMYTRESLRLREAFLQEAGVTAELASKERQLAATAKQAADEHEQLANVLKGSYQSALVKSGEESRRAAAEMQSRGRVVAEMVRTPVERYNAKIADLNSLERNGAISKQTLARAQLMYRQELHDSLLAQNQWAQSLQQAGIGTRVLSLATNPLALGIAAVAAAATGAIAAVYGLVRAYETFVKPQADAIEMTLALSERLGLSTEMLSALGHAAKMSEVEQGTFVKGLSTMTRRLSEAATKGGETAKMLKALGLDAKQLAQADTSEAFLQISDAIAKLPTQGQKAQAAFALFGRSGVEMVGMLQQGRAGLQGWMADAQELGIVFSKAQAEMVDAANDSRDRLGAALKGVATIAAIELAPAIQAVAEWLIELVKNPVARGSLADAFRIAGGAMLAVAEETHRWLSMLFEAQKVVLQIQKIVADIAGNELLSQEAQRAIDGLNEAIKNSPKAMADKITKGEGPKGNSGASGSWGLDFDETGKQTAAAHSRVVDFYRDARKLVEDVRTPQQKYNDTIKQLGEALAFGAINFAEFTQAAGKARNELKEAAAKSEEFRESQRKWADLGKAAQRIRDQNMTPEEKRDRAFQDVTKLWSLGLLTWKEYQREIARVNKELEDTNNKSSGLTKHQQELKEAAQKTLEGIRTPLDEYQARVAEIREQFSANFLTSEQAAAALNQAGAAYNKSLADRLPAKGGNKALEFGTAEAFSEVLRHRRGGDDPMKQLQKHTAQSAETLLRIEENTAREAIEIRQFNIA